MGWPWPRATVVFRKEMVDNLRDRRSLASALVYPLLGPVLMVTLLSVVQRSLSDRREEPLRLPVAGAERAPDLVVFLRQHEVTVVPAPADPAAAVRAGQEDVVLVVPAGFADAFAAGRPAPLQLVVDDSRQSAGVNVRRARAALGAYSSQVAALRLTARGVSPAIITPLAVETLDMATPQSQAALFLNLMPYFLIFSVFIGGMYLAIDSTAGERERGSLEPLLLNPVARSELVIGKLAAVLVFTVVATAETLLGFALILRAAPLDRILGVQMDLRPLSLLGAFLITIPIMPLAAGVQLIIASFTRSFKEAQNYLSLLPLIPALPGMFLAFVPVEPRLWTMLVPTFGQQLLINQLLRGETVAVANVAIATLATLLVAMLAVALVIRLYERERILFGR